MIFREQCNADLLENFTLNKFNNPNIPVLKMQTEQEVFMVKVIDRLECAGCAGRYEQVEVRVARTPSYEENAVSCGIESGDGIKNFVYK